MRRKRDRLEVIYDFLKIIQEHHNSIRPTPLLRKTNLSSQSYSEYYAEMLEKQFIKEIEDKNRRKYVTLTDKGFRYLNKYRMILGFINDFEL
ncbi:MAG: winged helix-turn-helix domain-containing protein [Candidatus Woesearchaeota archaeon]